MNPAYETEYRQLGLRIAYYRKLRGLTQEQLAEQTGLTPNTVSRIERGLLTPSVETLCDICNALGTDADSILAAYIQADTARRWAPTNERIQQLPMDKQTIVQNVLECLLDNLI